MAKYRVLTLEELEEMRSEFISFLAVNGMEADEWTRIKKEEEYRSELLIHQFSDMVLEEVMQKVGFLQFRSKKEVTCIQCLGEKMILVGMKASDESMDFDDQEFINKAIQSPPKGLKIYTSEKHYSKSRAQEIFEMTQSGCKVSDGRLFKALYLATV